MSETITVRVHNDMQLGLSPQEIGREGEHNSAVFKIVQQPASLDALACRAEVTIAGKSTYRLVTDREFNLTNDITEVKGTGTIQLVYSDGTEVIRKTQEARFFVASSVNAIDPSDPNFQDGLAQLQLSSFARAIGSDSGITFYNVSAQPLDFVAYPPQGAGDLTEARADTLYLRMNGANAMSASVNILGPNRGVTWEPAGIQGALYSTGTQLVMRLPINNPPFVIEDNSGVAGTRTPVITQAMGDNRYLQPATANNTYVAIDGTTGMTGDLRMISSAGIDEPIGVYIGGRQSSIMWNNALQLRRGLAGEPVQVTDVNGGNASEVVTRALGATLYVTPEALEPYLLKAGGQMTGPLITQTGTSNTNPGIGVGDNSTGFWRTSTYLICIMGGQTVWQSNTTEMLFGVRLNAATQPIWNLGDARPDAIGAMDAVNRRSMDAAIAAAPRPNSRTYIPDPVEIPTGTGAIVFFNQPFPTANNNPRTITITIFPAYTGGTPSAFYDLAYTCGLLPLALVEARQAVYATANAYMQGPIRFAATVTPVGNQIQVQLSVREVSNNPTRLNQAGAAADRRSYVTIEEQAN